jgi:hypothetical protein
MASKMDKNIDTKMYQINQAAQGVWWNAQTMPLYKLGISLLYTVVVDGLGRTIIDQGSDTFMASIHLTDAAHMQTVFFSENPITTEVANQLFNDGNYGLGNTDKYILWDQLITSKTDPLVTINFQNEIMAYFKLTQAQIDEFARKYNEYSVLMEKAFIDGMDTAYENKLGVAYLQWSSGYVTKRYMSVDSVTKVVNTVKGYPEMSYFMT